MVTATHGQLYYDVYTVSLVSSLDRRPSRVFHKKDIILRFEDFRLMILRYVNDSTFYKLF